MKSLRIRGYLFLSTSCLLALPLGGATVTNCTEANLRAAMVRGGTVGFACDGTITLANTITNDFDTVLDASGRSITISGGEQVQVFYLATNTSLTLVNLKVAGGFAVNGFGGAVVNDGGSLILLSSTFETNQASGGWDFSPAGGGAIVNQGGVVNATNSVFSWNTARVGWSPGGGPKIVARGGAILNQSGSVNLQNCTFVGNGAWGGNGQSPESGSSGSGGAIESSGTLSVTRCTFVENTAKGGTGGSGPYEGTSGGSGSGGAIYATGPLVVDASSFLSNTVVGGNGGNAGGPVLPSYHGLAGGWAGSATGGAISGNSNGFAVNSSFAYNTAIGGRGGAGGNGASSNLSGVPGGDGGEGGDSGDAFGGIYGGIHLTNCTLAFNSGLATNGGLGGYGGTGAGGAPDGQRGPNGGSGQACGGMGGGLCVNTILAGNSPGGNCFGVADGGHNLSSDASCAFSAAGMNNTDPKLDAPANNGGPTWTMALLPGSPAIDSGDDALAPGTDQRGVPRPVWSHSDIGAYEVTALMRVVESSQSSFDLLVCGPVGQSCRLLTSTTFSNWQAVATNQIGPDGTALFQQDYDPGATQRFYWVSFP